MFDVGPLEGACWAHVGPCWAQVWQLSRFWVPLKQRGKTEDSRAILASPSYSLIAIAIASGSCVPTKNASAPSVRADFLDVVAVADFARSSKHPCPGSFMATTSVAVTASTGRNPSQPETSASAASPCRPRLKQIHRISRPMGSMTHLTHLAHLAHLHQAHQAHQADLARLACMELCQLCLCLELCPDLLKGLKDQGCQSQQINGSLHPSECQCRVCQCRLQLLCWNHFGQCYKRR